MSVWRNPVPIRHPEPVEGYYNADMLRLTLSMTNLECAPPQSRYARQLSRAGRALPSVIVRAANALTLRKRRAQRTVLCAKNAFATHGGAMHAPPEESLLMPPPAEGGRGVGTSSKFFAVGGIHFRRGRPHLQRHRRLIVR